LQKNTTATRSGFLLTPIRMTFNDLESGTQPAVGLGAQAPQTVD